MMIEASQRVIRMNIEELGGMSSLKRYLITKTATLPEYLKVERTGFKQSRSINSLCNYNKMCWLRSRVQIINHPVHFLLF
jgi:hypothetical protein